MRGKQKPDGLQSAIDNRLTVYRLMETLSKISMGSITAGLILKGADAAGIYGSRAAQGVLIPKHQRAHRLTKHQRRGRLSRSAKTLTKRLSFPAGTRGCRWLLPFQLHHAGNGYGMELEDIGAYEGCTLCLCGAKAANPHEPDGAA